MNDLCAILTIQGFVDGKIKSIEKQYDCWTLEQAEDPSRMIYFDMLNMVKEFKATQFPTDTSLK